MCDHNIPGQDPLRKHVSDILFGESLHYFRSAVGKVPVGVPRHECIIGDEPDPAVWIAPCLYQVLKHGAADLLHSIRIKIWIKQTGAESSKQFRHILGNASEMISGEIVIEVACPFRLCQVHQLSPHRTWVLLRTHDRAFECKPFEALGFRRECSGTSDYEDGNPFNCIIRQRPRDHGDAVGKGQLLDSFRNSSSHTEEDCGE